MERAQFVCVACDLRIDAEVSPDLTENAGPFLRVFWCQKEKKHLTLDAEAEDFRGRCPTCGEAVAVLRFPLAACPRCFVTAKQRRAYTGPL